MKIINTMKIMHCSLPQLYADVISFCNNAHLVVI